MLDDATHPLRGTEDQSKLGQKNSYSQQSQLYV